MIEDTLSSLSLTGWNKVRNNFVLDLKRLRSFSEKLNLQQSLLFIDEVIARIENYTFWIAVVGEIKRGKSTFINALLGQEILPLDIEPCSATLTRVTYGLDSYVEVEFKDGHQEKIEIEKLSEYVTQLTPEAEATAANVKEAVVYYPAKYCRNNVDIIYTPSLDDDSSMVTVTLSVLPKVDVAIMVIMAQVPFSEVERDFLQNKLLTSDLGRIIFVVNGIDRCNRTEDADKVIAIVQKRIEKCVLERAAQQWGKDSTEYEVYRKKIGKPKVFGLSASQALKAKINNDDELLAKSRFTEFEQALEEFLPKERDAITLQVSLNLAIASSAEILSVINIQENALNMKLEEFERAYGTSIKEISEIRQRRKEEMQLIDQAAENIKLNVRPLLNKLEDDLKQTAIQAIDSTKITPEELSNKKVLTKKLGDKVSSSLRNSVQKLVDKIQSEFEAASNCQKNSIEETIADVDSFAKVIISIDSLVMRIAVISSFIVDGWLTKLVFGSESVNAFKENYKGVVLKEIEKQLKLDPINKKLEDYISACFEHLKQTLSQEVEALLDNTQNTLIELNHKRQRNEVLTEAERKELAEIRAETEIILGSAERRSKELAEIMSF
ncbi:MAG: dynamin family protein [Goleter apudmare HA4340-LM2]|nr:dynamin family protein [Goleter apudmare HA4340-LM2]